MNLFDVLVAAADRHGAQPALTDLASDVTLTYADVLGTAEGVAHMLRQQGVEPGQRVALLAGNGLAHVPTAFGIVASGACVVPIAPTLRAAEVDAVLAGTDVNAVVRLAEGAAVLEWIDRERRAPAGFEALNPAFVRFTSGTTADQKGVILEHDEVAARVASADAVLRLDRTDRVLWTLPLAYHFAATIVSYVRAGAHVLLCQDTLPGPLVDACARHRATLLYGSPIQFERMAHAPHRPRLADVRLALSTAMALPQEVADRFEAAFAIPLGQAYGIIEAGLPCINTRSDGESAASVGRPVPGYDVAVFGDDGSALAAGAIGEVGVRGPGLFSGYYQPWRPRTTLLRDGWFMTGDLGGLDSARCLTLRGRTKSTIIVAGMKVFPEEVEAVLNRQPGVSASRVVGRAHPRLGEIPCAEIVPQAGVEPDVRGLAAACAEVLSSYKVPIEFRLVSAIPRTPAGKIRRSH
ncbi:MAG: class I adenylate-forming enzyme family protein [Ardenticatenales bacterium]